MCIVDWVNFFLRSLLVNSWLQQFINIYNKPSALQVFYVYLQNVWVHHKHLVGLENMNLLHKSEMMNMIK